MMDFPKQLNDFVAGEAAKHAQTQAASLINKYGRIRPQLVELKKALDACLPRLAPLTFETRNALDPGWQTFDPTRSDLSTFSLYRLLNLLGYTITNKTSASSTRLYAMLQHCDAVLAVFRPQIEYSSLAAADESGRELMRLAAEEFEFTVLDWRNVLNAVYLAIKQEYRRLRKKYLGQSAKDEHDPLEDRMMMQLFGIDKKPETPLGPATALIDDNCVLTQLLTDASEAMPTYYERVVPVKKKGQVTSESKTVKFLDDGEIHDAAGALLRLAHPMFIRYASDPATVISGY